MTVTAFSAYKRMKTMYLNIFRTSGVRVYTLLIGVVSLALTARVLGPEGRGLIAGVTSWLILFATLGSLSLGQVITHRATEHAGEPWLRLIFGTLLVLAGALSIVSWLAAVAMAHINPNMYGSLPFWALALGFSMLPFYIWERYGAQLLISTGNLEFYNRRLVAISTVGLVVLAGVLLILEAGVIGALSVTVAVAALASLGGMYRLWILSGRSIIFDKNEAALLVRDGAKLHLNAVGGTMLSVVSVLMVNYYGSQAEVGQFQLAMQLAMVLMIVPQSTAMVLSQEMAKSGVDAVWAKQKRVILRMLAVVVVLSVAAYLVAPRLIVLVAGNRFEPAAEIFRVLLLGGLGLSLAYGMANQWLGRGLFIQTSLLTLLFGGLNVVLGIFWIPRYGAIGAAWSFATAYLLGILTNVGMAILIERRLRIVTGKASQGFNNDSH